MRPPGSASRFGLRAPSRRGLLAAAAVLVVGAVVALRLPARLVLESRVLNSSAVKSQPVNALGIGVDDIAELSGRALVLARFVGDDARPQWQHNFDSPPQFSLVADVDGDGLDEMCLGTRDSAGAWALVLSKDERPTRFGPLLDPAAAPTAETGPWLLPWAVLADSGEARGLVCGTVNMYGPPRGIALYDVATAERRWSFAMGAWPGDVVVADLLGDGHAGLVVAGNSPANGMAVNGTDDSHACVVALDASGRRLWQVPLAGDFAKVQLLALPVERGGAARLVAAVRSERARDPEPCALVVLDGRTGAIEARREFARSLGQPRLLDPTRGSFVVGCEDSVLRAFDGTLRELARHRAPRRVEAWGVAALGGEGAKAVVASTDREILLLDERLRLQVRRALAAPGEGPYALAIARAGLGRVRLVATAGPCAVFDVRALARWSDWHRWAVVLAAALLAGALVPALGAAWRRSRLPSVRESRDFLVDYRQVRHDIFDEVRPFGALWNWAHEAVADSPVPLDEFERARDQFLGIGQGTLSRFIARAGKLRVSGGLVERMGRTLRGLEELLREPLEGPGAELTRRARAVALTMRALSDDCAGAYREVAERGPCRADRAVQDALLAQQGTLVSRGVAVHSGVDAGAGVPVLFDAGELRELVGQLLENALAALEGVPGPELRVSVSLDPLDGRHVILRVADNGPGIPAGEREAVFAPGRSSRPGGGFGLGHAREVARSWRSDLAVEDTPGGRGATLRLTLAVLFPFERGSA
jgi:signal transduction histidine kinase